MSDQSRIRWLDSLKGIGILAVVGGHVYSSIPRQIIFMFHMPLFFLIGGYLLKINDDDRLFLREKARHLLLPYVAFLILIYTPEALLRLVSQQNSTLSIADILWQPLFGGRALGGPTGVFWFVTCFFVTQQTAHWLLKRFSNRIVVLLMLLMLVLGYANAALMPDVWFPWNVNVVLVGTPLFIFGYYCKKGDLHIGGFFASCGVIGGICLLMFGFPNTLDMKTADYGIPVITLFCSVTFASLLVSTCKIIDNWTFLSKPLGKLGEASMVIMYLHQAIQMTLAKIGFANAVSFRFFMAVAMSYVFYRCAQRFEFGRQVFLGLPSRRINDIWAWRM